MKFTQFFSGVKRMDLRIKNLGYKANTESNILIEIPEYYGIIAVK